MTSIPALDIIYQKEDVDHMSLGYSIFRYLYLYSFTGIIARKDRKRLKRTVLPEGVEESEYNEGSMHYLIHRKKNAKENDGILFDIHGGGFCYGDKELNRPFNMTMAKKGFTVVSMDYRLVDKVYIKDQVQDIIDIMNHIHRKKDELGLDFHGPVFLAGDSAGGMLAGVIVALTKSKKLQTIFDRKLDFSFDKLVLNHPVGYTMDIGNRFPVPGLKKSISKWTSVLLYGKSYQEDPVYQNVSSFDSLLELASFPKTMIVTSPNDTSFYPIALRQKEALDRHHVENTIFIQTKKPNGHVFNLAEINSPSGEEANEKISSFLRSH